MPKFSKTVRAFLAEDGTKWAIVDALAAEMPGHVSAGELGECRGYLAEHGIDKAVGTIKDYRVVGRFVEEATTAQAKVFRAQAVSTIRTFVMRAASQEFAAAAISDFQAREGRERMPKSVAHSLFSTEAGRDRLADDPEQWNEAQWAAFDRKTVEAARTLLTALNVWQRGIYKPSVEALAQLALIKPADLDAELALMLEGA